MRFGQQLERRSYIAVSRWPVQKQQVHIVDLKILEAALDRRNEVAGAKALRRDLGRDAQLLAVDSASLPYICAVSKAR